MCGSAEVRIYCKGVFVHNFSAYQMPLYDFLEHLRRAGVVPDTFRIDHRNGAALAHAQAVRFGSVNDWFWPRKLELFEARF